MIKDNYSVEVKRAFIVYIRSKNKLIEIDIKDKIYSDVQKILNEIINIIQKGYFPKRTKYRSRCRDCTYRNICIK
jgi:CRISPR-associated exonuclease Cas4